MVSNEIIVAFPVNQYWDFRFLDVSPMFERHMEPLTTTAYFVKAFEPIFEDLAAREKVPHILDLKVNWEDLDLDSYIISVA